MAGYVVLNIPAPCSECGHSDPIRLLQHYVQYFSRLDGSERDAISKVRDALWRIVDEDTN